MAAALVFCRLVVIWLLDKCVKYAICIYFCCSFCWNWIYVHKSLPSLHSSAIHCSFILFVFYLASQVDKVCKMLVCFIKSCFIICSRYHESLACKRVDICHVRSFECSKCISQALCLLCCSISSSLVEWRAWRRAK